MRLQSSPNYTRRCTDGCVLIELIGWHKGKGDAVHDKFLLYKSIEENKFENILVLWVKISEAKNAQRW